MYFTDNGKQYTLDPKMVDLAGAYEYYGTVNFPYLKCDLSCEEGTSIQEAGLCICIDPPEAIGAPENIFFYVMTERLCDENDFGDTEVDSELYFVGAIPKCLMKSLKEKTKKIYGNILK